MNVISPVRPIPAHFFVVITSYLTATALPPTFHCLSTARTRVDVKCVMLCFVQVRRGGDTEGSVSGLGSLLGSEHDLSLNMSM